MFSNFFVALSSALAICALASPIIFPNDAFSSGEREPSDLLANEIGALSPMCARRALLSSSRSPAERKAA